MRRPLYTVGITMLLTLFVLCQAENILLTFSCCGLFVLLFIIYLFNKEKFRTLILPTVILSVAVSCFLFAFSELFVYSPYVSLSGSCAEGTFVLTEYPAYKDGRYYCMAEYTDNSKRAYRVRLSLPCVSEYENGYEKEISSLRPGDEVMFRARFYSVGGEDKNMRLSFKSKGVYLGAYPLSEVEAVRKGKVSVLNFLKREKMRTVNLLLSSFDRETAAIGTSLLMGDKNLIDNGSYETVKRAGASHLLAVSGLHLSVWIMLVIRIIDTIGLNRRRWAVLLLVFDFLVMFFASFSGSVVRAGIMMALYLFGVVAKRKGDSLNSLGGSAALILLFSPYSAANVSFLLSFVACYSIVTVASYIIFLAERRAEGLLYAKPWLKILTAVFSSAVISAVVSVYTLPLMIYYFGTVSLMSVITNILLAFVSAPVIVSFGIYVMLWFIPVLSAFLYGCAFVFTKYLLFCVNLMSTEKGVVNVKTNGIILPFGLTVIMLAAVFIKDFRRYKNDPRTAFR